MWKQYETDDVIENTNVSNNKYKYYCEAYDDENNLKLKKQTVADAARYILSINNKDVRLNYVMSKIIRSNGCRIYGYRWKIYKELDK